MCGPTVIDLSSHIMMVSSKNSHRTLLDESIANGIVIHLGNCARWYATDIPTTFVCHINHHEGYARPQYFPPFPTRTFSPNSPTFVLSPEAPRPPERSPISTTLEMALLRRQTLDFEYYDEGSPFLSFLGNWTRYKHKNGTLRITSTPGSDRKSVV